MKSPEKSPEGSGKVYRELGVRPIINAMGPATILGGTRLLPEALAAMAEASNSLVNMAELNTKAGELIAKITGAEAAMVCNGAASGITLATAAAIAGNDPVLMGRLPNTRGLKNEVIIQTMHRFGYDQAYQVAGAELMYVGTAIRCNEWELEGAINERTAAVAYLHSPWIRHTALPLPQVAEIAHRHGVPVIVDAANMLPPRENLTKYLRQGADVVIISGGKGIRGPQGSGLLYGKRDLVQAAAANASPNQFIGRGMKVSKEDIVGLITALEFFLEQDEEEQMLRWKRMAQQVVDALTEIPGIHLSVEHDDLDFLIPAALIRFEKSWQGPKRAELIRALEASDPPIYLQTFFLPENMMAVDPISLEDWELDILIPRLREELLR